MKKIKWRRMRPSLGALATVGLLCLASSSHANILPVEDETHTRIVSKDETLQKESNYKKLYTEEMEKKLGDLRAKFKQEYEKSNEIPNSETVKRIGRESGNQAATDLGFFRPKQKMPQAKSPHVISYTVTEDNDSETKNVLPLGSTVAATVLSGVEAGPTEPYPVLLALSTAFIGPNRRRIDLSNCFMLAKAKANLSVERVIGETTEISCIRDNGEHIRRPAQGYLSGKDSTFGVAGKLISNQQQVFLTAVLANLAKGAGEAVAMAQKSTQVVSSNSGAQAATNVTGSPALLAAGQATTDAAAMIAEWYLSYAKQLIPSIAVGSGAEVFVTLLDTVQIPSLETEED